MGVSMGFDAKSIRERRDRLYRILPTQKTALDAFWRVWCAGVGWGWVGVRALNGGVGMDEGRV